MKDALTVGYGRLDPVDPLYFPARQPHPIFPNIAKDDVVVNAAPILSNRNIPLSQIGTDNYAKYKRFMPIAQAFAQMSKDPSTKVGCVILGTGTFEVKSSGWNGAVRGCKADEDHRFADRSTKLLWAAHAEANAISNAARTGTPLQGSTMVVTHMPCSSCAKLIVQSGVSAVVCPRPSGDFATRWAEDIAVTREMFAECSVRLVEFEA